MDRTNAPLGQWSSSLAFVFVLVLASLSLFNQEAAAQSVGPDGTLPSGTLPPALDAQITFIHAAPVFSNTVLTAIDVCDEQGQVLDGLAGVVYGQSVTFRTDAGEFDWKITAPNSNCATLVKDIPPFTVGYGGAVIVIAVGDAINQPIDVWVITTESGRWLPVHAAHQERMIPGVGKNSSRNRTPGPGPDFRCLRDFGSPNWGRVRG